jgi:hypothetical protein
MLFIAGLESSHAAPFQSSHTLFVCYIQRYISERSIAVGYCQCGPRA